MAAFLVLLPAAIAIVATHKARSPVSATDLGRPSEDVILTTYDGLRLAGSYVASRNGAAIVVFPGRAQPVPQARMLVRHGYGVLLLDRRGEGASEGTTTRSAEAARRTSRPPWATCAAEPTSTPAASAGSACRSAAS